MNSIRKKSVPLSLLLAALMLQMSAPIQPALAAMVGTESTLGDMALERNSDLISSFMAREDVRKILIFDHGLSPEEVEARMASLTDSEILEISRQIDQLPAGGNGVGLAIGVLLIVLLVLVILRLA